MKPGRVRAAAAHRLGPRAEQVARWLSRLIDAPLVLQRYSRLAHDCNRMPDSPDAMPEISEITHIPGNRNLTPADQLARIHRIYQRFHMAIAELLDCRAAEGVRSMVVTVHSFTPVYKGTPRALELGILHDRDTRTACCTRSICMRRPAASRTS